MNATLTEIYRATFEWWQIVERQGRISILSGPEGEPGSSQYDAAVVLAGYDPDDLECGVGIVETAGEQDAIIHPRDLVVFGGYGADVVFLRES